MMKVRNVTLVPKRKTMNRPVLFYLLSLILLGFQAPDK